jgi:carboxypeptidase T
MTDGLKTMRLLRIIATTTVMLCSVVHAGAAEGPWLRVRLDAGRQDLARLGAAGIAAEEAVRGPNGGLVIVLSEAEAARVRALGIAMSVLDADVSRTYAERAQRATPAMVQRTQSRAAHFHLGSMGGYLTLAEVESELDSMRRAFPLLVSYRQAIGVTAENRTIWAVRISRNPDVEETEPRVLFTALHHAREPGGMMTLLYTMWYLLEQYGTNDDVTDILDHRDLVFVPVVNPDGYLYNEITVPAGGGMWRKNRRKNDDGSFGVDLNRNYGYKWGYDNTGSSASASNETYRGPSAFSEPETAALRDLCVARGFSLAVNYHSFANALIHPWGWSSTPPPDSTVYRRLASILTDKNYYDSGTGLETIGYATNGDADDWMYGEQAAKPRMYSMTIEVGGTDDGFWPEPARILPIADENLDANILAARLAGECYGLELVAHEQKHDNDTVSLAVRLVNNGVQAAKAGVSIQLTATNGVVLAPASLFLGVSAATQLPVRIKRTNGLANGSRLQLFSQVISPAGRFHDSVEVRLGVPEVKLADVVDSARASWQAATNDPSSGWDTTRTAAWSGRLSYTDSPFGDYARNLTSTFTLKDPIVLGGIAAELRFRSRWDIEPGYDIVYVEVSTNAGASWIPMESRHTRPGSGLSGGKQAAGMPGLDRRQREWVEEAVDLDRFVGSSIRVRFRLESDSYVSGDGIYLDDIRVLVWLAQPANVSSVATPAGIRLLQNYPNPFNGQTRIRFDIVTGSDPAITLPVTLSIYDLLGRERMLLLKAPLSAGTHEVAFDAASLPSGVYFYRLHCGETALTRPMVLVR